MILMELLVSVMESAYYLYEDQDSDFKAQQWDGWRRYIKSWFERDDFRNAWETHLGDQFDIKFIDAMKILLDEVKLEESARVSAMLPGRHEQSLS